jgi:hypothetical protein
MLRELKSVRLLVVAVSMAAWFVASNHCLLAATPATDKAAGCPMHAQKQHAPQPAKGNGCGDLPCCKNLQATAVASAKAIAKPIWLGALQPFFAIPVTTIEPAERQISPILDNGPPGENTFTELVLQRSVRAHAPPVSLS